MQKRKERDTMGEVLVANDKLWGAQTQRSLQNFAIGPQGSMPVEVIRAFGFLKKAAALSNRDLGVLSEEKALLIGTVCDEIVQGKLDEHFPLVIWQTGSGTHTNMNVNEVIANRIHVMTGKQLGEGTREVHPNDDVNRSQSSNDTFPTAMHIAACIALHRNTLPSLQRLSEVLQEKSEKYAEIVKIGRTHMMDATPLTLGQEFSGYHQLVQQGVVSLQQALEQLRQLALGGTAVGTGINCPKGYSDKVAEYISDFTGISFVSAVNKFEALSAHDAMVRAHAALKQTAVSLHKIGHDIRVLSSGPRCGLGELVLPANEPGSSIMPGKVNPSQVEALTMVCAQVMGNDVAIGFGAANGHFELNVYKPLIISNFLQSAVLLGDAVMSFTENCVVGLEPDEKRIAQFLGNSLMLVTALTPHIGYEKAAEIAKNAHANGTSLKEEILRTLDVDASRVDEWLDPEKMVGEKNR